MSQWADLDLDGTVVDLLAAASAADDGHHFGRPFLTADQLAIGLARPYVDTFEAIGLPIGGSGTGHRDSLAKYLARELSGKIKAKGARYPVDGSISVPRRKR